MCFDASNSVFSFAKYYVWNIIIYIFEENHINDMFNEAKKAIFLGQKSHFFETWKIRSFITGCIPTACK